MFLRVVLDNKNQTKDKYGQYSDKNEFSEYWDNYHSLELLSMKESIHQKKTRIEKLKSKAR